MESSSPTRCAKAPRLRPDASIRPSTRSDISCMTLMLARRLRKSQNAGMMAAAPESREQARDAPRGSDCVDDHRAGRGAAVVDCGPAVPDKGGSLPSAAPTGRSPTCASRGDQETDAVTHVVDLQSLDEDRLGQELSVVWELEVGQTVAPDQGLPETISPDGFDDPNTLAAFVDAVRWGAVTSADDNAYQSPFRSGANVEAYQLEPLRRALQSARTNLLLADDVGPGQDHRGRPGHPGAAAAPPRPVGDHRLPAGAGPEVAGRDAGEVRPRLRDRQQRAAGRGAPQPRARTPTRSGCFPG